jgi:hypothetical protein
MQATEEVHAIGSANTTMPQTNPLDMITETTTDDPVDNADSITSDDDEEVEHDVGNQATMVIYPCRYCTIKPFDNQKAMLCHERSVHRFKSEKCPLCAYAVTNRYKVSRHYRKTHPEGPPLVQSKKRRFKNQPRKNHGIVIPNPKYTKPR